MAYIIRIEKDSHTNGTLRIKVENAGGDEVFSRINPCDGAWFGIIQRGYMDVHNEHINGRLNWDPGSIAHKTNHQVIRGFRAECQLTEREEMLPSNSLKVNGKLFRRQSYHSHTYRVVNNAIPHIGFELEFVCPSSEGIRIVNPLIKPEFLDSLWTESDGSIGSNGIEIISEPFTREQLVEWEESIAELLKELDAKGCKSHDTSTCGLHFHCSIKPGKDYKEQYYKHLDYYIENKDEYLKLARRTSSYHESTISYSRLQSINTERYCRISCKANGSSAPRTFEWRFFRGTMAPVTFLKIAHRIFDCVEFAYGDEQIALSYTLKKTYDDIPSRVRNEFPIGSDEAKVKIARAYMYTQTEDVVQRMKSYIEEQNRIASEVATPTVRRGRRTNAEIAAALSADVLADAVTNNNTIIEGGN